MPAERYSRKFLPKVSRARRLHCESARIKAQESAVKRRKIRPAKTVFIIQYQLLSRWLGREDSNLRMAESKSDQFANDINVHSEKLSKFDPLSANRLALDSECWSPANWMEFTRDSETKTDPTKQACRIMIRRGWAIPSPRQIGPGF
jgi:hypothetical protein